MLRITSSLPRCWLLGSNKIKNDITKIPLDDRVEFLFYEVMQNMVSPLFTGGVPIL